MNEYNHRRHNRTIGRGNGVSTIGGDLETDSQAVETSFPLNRMAVRDTKKKKWILHEHLGIHTVAMSVPP